ncbi:MAG: GTP cyclohydrolase I FolE, partial [Cyanothece sp. SIO1E1]|nr:GTP cyclohydrolase I FolE [Cyanothece sp. SIO1E1]
MSYQKSEEYSPKVTENLMESFNVLLREVGEDPDREGLIKTPERAAKAMQFLTQGYAQNAEQILRSAMFQEDYS